VGDLGSKYVNELTAKKWGIAALLTGLDFSRRFRRKTPMLSWQDECVPNVAKAIESFATICGICGQFSSSRPRGAFAANLSF